MKEKERKVHFLRKREKQQLQREQKLLERTKGVCLCGGEATAAPNSC